MKIAKALVFAGLFLQAVSLFIWHWRQGRTEIAADIGLIALLFGLMVKNPSRGVYAVTVFSLLSLFVMAIAWLWLPHADSSRMVLESLVSAAMVAASICLVMAQRRSGEPTVARVAFGKLGLSVSLVLIVGLLCQLTWRTWHAAYFAPMDMHEIENLPAYFARIVDISIDWQANYGFWRFLLGLALIFTVDAQVVARYFLARLFLATYLLLIVAVSVGYLSAK